MNFSNWTDNLTDEERAKTYEEICEHYEDQITLIQELKTLDINSRIV
jgi:hypothetical protein